MKKTVSLIFILFICVLSVSAQKSIIWEEPQIGYSQIPYFKITEVELAKKYTALHVSYSSMSDGGFRISQNSYLQSGGKQYPIVKSDSIPLDDWVKIDESGHKDFVLYFNPLPKKTTDFDFLEGLEEDDFKVFNIHPMGTVMPDVVLPAEYLTDNATEDEWAEMKYSEVPAVLNVEALNYRKGMCTEIRVLYVDLSCPDEAKEIVGHLNDDGKLSLKLPILYPQIVEVVCVNYPWCSEATCYLVPGKEMTILMDMLRSDEGSNSKFIGYKGHASRFAKEWYETVKKYEESDVSKTMPVLCRDSIRTVKELIEFEDKGIEAFNKAILSFPMEKMLQDYFVVSNDVHRCTLGFVYLYETKEYLDHALKYHLTLPECTNFPLTGLTVDFGKFWMTADEKGFQYDLARYCYYLPKALNGQDIAKPVIYDPDLSRLYDKYVDEARAKIASEKANLPENVHYLDMVDVAPENVVQALLSKYPGKAVFIDIWATWCGPCRHGHKLFAPLKEDMKDKDVVFVNITSNSSPVDEWREMITEISGEHYYLTSEQLNAMMSHFDSSGYPTYVIFDKDGNPAFKCVGVPNFDDMKAELEKIVK